MGGVSGRHSKERRNDRFRKAFAFLISLVFCASAAAAQFSFAAFGDIPYNAAEEPQLISMIAEMNRERLAFSMHVGDFKSAQSECSDALFLQRREAFALSHHAFVYIPGDNEWIDCGRAYWARRDPLERLGKLRELFFAADSTLGQRPIAVARQAGGGYPEHLRWTVDGVVFATVNVPGPGNNSGAPQESKPRTAAVLDWIREAFTMARRDKSPAVVLGVHANIFNGSAAYSDILDAIAREALSYDGQMLIVHGDTHLYRYDQPLVDRRSGRKVPNVQRLEVSGSPFVNWFYVTVTVTNGRAGFSVSPASERLTQR